MATVSVSLPSDGQTIDAADYNTPINTIVTEINGSLDSDNIAEGGVVPNSLTSGTGTSWTWQSWTPTYSNLTVGNGTTGYAKYTQIGKTVHCRIKFQLGSTSSVTGNIGFSLPVTANSDYTDNTPIDGRAIISDSGVGFYPAQVLFASTTTAKVNAIGAGGTYADNQATSSTVPMTWTTNDSFLAAFSYEAA